MLQGLSFVLPMYNEAGNIRRMTEETLDAGRRLARDFEIIIVDDASTDGSGEMADALAMEHPEVRVIHHRVNRKLGGALRTGFAAASREYVLYIDSDLPIDMKDADGAMMLIAASDMVIGYRTSRAEGAKRAVMSWAYNRLIRLVFGLKVKDVNFAFKLFRREILDHMTLESEGSFIDAELLIEASRRGYRIKEYGLKYYPRIAGVSTLSGLNIILKILSEMRGYIRRSGLARKLERGRVEMPALVPVPDVHRHVDKVE
jgi:glycosyltransferase involved in cell wall biosynthesis